MVATITYQPIANSSYLDFTSYRVTSAPTVESAFGIIDGTAATKGIDVALVLPRVTDPAGLLAQDWGTRQDTIENLLSTKQLWATYGANGTQYNNLVAALGNAGLTVLDSKNSNYVSSAESRTVWVHLEAADFQTVFNTQLMHSDGAGLTYWNGDLSLPSGWGVTGLWLEIGKKAPATNMSSGSPVTLSLGEQGIGNSTTEKHTGQYPQDIGSLFNFPLDGQEVAATAPIGLIEPGIGSALKSGETKSFEQLLKEYEAKAGTSGSGKVEVQGEHDQAYSDSAGERSLDVGVVAAVNPNSDIRLYVGSGANAGVYSSAQSAIWDTATKAVGNTSSKAPVTSSSYSFSERLSPDSPFYRAVSELFTDAALANQTTLIAAGDSGSGAQTGVGLPNVGDAGTQPWNILVSGTSLSTTAVATQDPTLSTIVATAMAGNQATIWQLVANGLTSLPADAASTQAFAESVWNNYFVRRDKSGQLIIEGDPHSDFSGGYLTNSAGLGGVVVSQPIPSYQVNSGLTPTTSDPQHLVGRGVPDVSAAAGGNLHYISPTGDLTSTTGEVGTSAASPLWASLIVQIDTVFQDQLLPNLGYMNDLLYIAAKVAPASFNDVQLGNNTSSFFLPGAYQTGKDQTDISPTGFGYNAEPGYDLASGLGSPNGLLLARALTAIAHTQMDQLAPPVLASYGAGGWTSSTAQSLLVQTVSTGPLTVGLTAGTSTVTLSSKGTATYAWTDRMAGQSEQSNFDANLVRTLDNAAQGTISEVSFNPGDTVGVSINGVNAQATTAALSNAYGFVDFQTADGLVRVARPVAVAETIDAPDYHKAIVNLRQDAADKLSITFYRVDKLDGSIGNIKPGDGDYAAAALKNAYHTAAGSTSIAGPGDGQFEQVQLKDMNYGDIVAMKLVDETSGKTYWGFSQQNDLVNGQHETHLWSYGLNTWGWDADGSHDFNDLLVNLDFTSAYGKGYLVSGADNSPVVPTAAWNDAYVLQQNQTLKIAALNGVLMNDASATKATLGTGPAHGSLQLGSDGSVNYTPTTGFTGIDSFSYKAADDSHSADAHVSVYVVPTLGTTLNLLALNAQEQVAATYTAFFGRGADLAGFQYWVNQVNAGSGQNPSALLASIANSFGVSREAKALYPLLADPKGANDAQINTFLDTVYNDLFGRSADAAGSAYWAGQIKQMAGAGQPLGSVVMNIISGTQAGSDTQTLIGKVAVGLEFVNQQQSSQMKWQDATDIALATTLLQGVTHEAQTVLVGLKQADQLVAVHT
jgi:hypothetical protein